MNSTINLKSSITCPKCGYEKEEMMATASCQFFYECATCQNIIQPKNGDCCVFCSNGTNLCPPIQKNSRCC